MSDSLRDAVIEIERHTAAGGWDQPPRLYALVPTAELVQQEPGLAEQLGVPATGAEGLTPVEQEPLPEGPLDEALARIAWPAEVGGCALVQEVVVLPPEVQEQAPEEGVEQWAAAHPDRREMRLVVGVLRDGSRHCALRLRDGEPPATGEDLAPNLAVALLATLED